MVTPNLDKRVWEVRLAGLVAAGLVAAGLEAVGLGVVDFLGVVDLEAAGLGAAGTLAVMAGVMVVGMVVGMVAGMVAALARVAGEEALEVARRYRSSEAWRVDSYWEILLMNQDPVGDTAEGLMAGITGVEDSMVAEGSMEVADLTEEVDSTVAAVGSKGNIGLDAEPAKNSHIFPSHLELLPHLAKYAPSSCHCFSISRKPTFTTLTLTI